MLTSGGTTVELFATSTCPYCAEVREQLDLDGVDYAEFDVETDRGAHARLGALLGTAVMVPVLVEDGRVRQVGVAGRGCYVADA